MSSNPSQSGQATVLTLVFLTVLLGMAALVLDLGAWYRADRGTQSTADAAALASAQGLPDDPLKATTLAVQYGDKNGGNVASSDVAVSTTWRPNDTVTVHVNRQADGVFSKLFGFSSVNVGSHATARVANPTQARFVAPIAVNKLHPDLLGTVGCPCYQQETTLPLGKTGAPGAFDLLNLDQSRGGTSPGTLADWILHGYDGYLPLGNYYSDPGAKFNSSHMQSALQQRVGTTLLFPVYDTLSGNGANAYYHVIGWVGFHMDAFSARGNSGTLTGYFTQVIWDGIESQSGTNQPDFGARSVQLID